MAASLSSVLKQFQVMLLLISYRTVNADWVAIDEWSLCKKRPTEEKWTDSSCQPSLVLLVGTICLLLRNSQFVPINNYPMPYPSLLSWVTVSYIVNIYRLEALIRNETFFAWFQNHIFWCSTTSSTGTVLLKANTPCKNTFDVENDR